ncbi:MAG: helix-turn-helix transcriptional regulator [Pseudomonadota bacterium]
MLEKVVDTLRERFAFDALLVGAGTRGVDGSITISDILGCHNIADAFIACYPKVANEDVVGQMFAAYPRIVQTVSVDDYRALAERETGSVAGARAGKVIAGYLEQFGFGHVMLAGLDSSFGLAWVTFYRNIEREPFGPADAEWARYLVPGLLFEWQRMTRVQECVELPSRLLPLTARELQIAIMSAQGLLPKTIADRLDLSTSTVREVIQNIRARLGVIGRKMTSEDLERYVSAPRAALACRG